MFLHRVSLTHGAGALGCILAPSCLDAIWYVSYAHTSDIVNITGMKRMYVKNILLQLVSTYSITVEYVEQLGI